MSDNRMVSSSGDTGRMSLLDKIIRFCLENKLVVVLVTLGVLAAGVLMAPFDWHVWGLPRNPVPVDAIPDIGENQQIVFTEWMGRSPQDVQDQITYPLTVSLLGIPGVKTVRSYSMFGFSTIYIIFKDNVEFYWSRSRVLEKLNSLPAGTVPQGVQPALGPDATALGQIFWYTLEGRDEDGNPTGGWDLNELRSIQDWNVRYALLSADGISEVASVGGFVKEYQIDVDPDAMRAHRVTLDEVFMAVKMSNVDVGARTIEVNKVEYIIRGLGFIENLSDIENSVIKVNENVPIYIKNVAKVSLGPGLRRGALDKGGAEAVGGVVVVRYGENPLAAIKNVKDKIAEIAPGLPAKAVIDFKKVSRAEVETFAQEHGFEAFTGAHLNKDAWLKWLQSTPREGRPDWVALSRVTIVPFYDRTGLINETLGTLNKALVEEILVTIIVVVVMLIHLRSSILVSGLLPLAVLMCFIAMRVVRVDANIVALSGIAIAIGTMVDMAIIVCENILKRLEQAGPDEKNTLETVFQATSEVGGAVVTAIATTVVSFLPVFTMTAAEGKLFKPLAFTKTFALLASVIIALTIIPPLAHVLFTSRFSSRKLKNVLLGCLVVVGIAGLITGFRLIGIIVAAFGLYYLLAERLPEKVRKFGPWTASAVAVVCVAVLLTNHWQPLGPGAGFIRNCIMVVAPIGALLIFFRLFQHVYAPILRWCLAHKLLFLSIPIILIFVGGLVWLGFDRVFGWAPRPMRTSRPFSYAAHKFPGLGREFMPPLDEGSFLYMPTTMPHASIGEALDVLQKMDMAFNSIPEVESVVGKIGRAETPLDPAPVSMIETVINYKSEYITDKQGHRVNFRYDRARDEFVRDENGELILDTRGRPYRLWRDHIKSPDDIWNEIVKAAQIPGTTSAPKLQPIMARIVMLQSGMRAPMGVKIKGPDLDSIEQVGLEIERLLKEVPSVEPSAVFADRIVGKPYQEIDIDREAAARYGIKIRQVQDVIEVAIGGRRITTTVEGRERYTVRVRYMRELRDQIETLKRVLVPAPDGTQIPLEQLAEIRYVRGPQAIKSEDTFLIGYVLFDMKPGYAEVDVVEDCQRYLTAKIDSGEFVLPAGVSHTFAGSYENQVRSQKRLFIVLPLALFIIFMILYFQFRSVPTTFLVFSGIIVAWAGGFILIWLYAQPWFLNVSLFGTNMRDLFQVHTINLSVAIWVGFLALFGIASDNGVVIATYLRQSFAARTIGSVEDVRAATVEGAVRRIRPCLMTSATTILALIPVLTSTGRGSDIMVPMAIPSFGGMLVVLVSVFVVPVLYCVIEESRLRVRLRRGDAGQVM
jgi:Cu(I)/Ag(I) efflux system membrane protein CusA/SilA